VCEYFLWGKKSVKLSNTISDELSIGESLDSPTTSHLTAKAERENSAPAKGDFLQH